jgi:hypothetical protein
MQVSSNFSSFVKSRTSLVVPEAQTPAAKPGNTAKTSAFSPAANATKPNVTRDVVDVKTTAPASANIAPAGVNVAQESAAPGSVAGSLTPPTRTAGGVANEPAAGTNNVKNPREVYREIYDSAASTASRLRELTKKALSSSGDELAAVQAEYKSVVESFLQKGQELLSSVPQAAARNPLYARGVSLANLGITSSTLDTTNLDKTFESLDRNANRLNAFAAVLPNLQKLYA